MVLKLEDKKTIVNEVAEVAKQAVSLIAAEYSGLTVGQLTALRKTARESGVYMRVVRNTLSAHVHLREHILLVCRMH